MGTSQTRRAKERVSTSRNTLKLEYLSNDLSGKGKKPSLVIANIKSPLLTYLSLSYLFLLIVLSDRCKDDISIWKLT